VLTHGHEDHIPAALPYILRDLNVPIYGTGFTLALVKKRLTEHGLLDSADLREVAAGQHSKIGCFDVEYIYVTHSTIDCVALAIRTPAGVVIHSGDYKMIRRRSTGNRLICTHSRVTATKAVLALFSDSTNVERTGVYAFGTRGVEPHRGIVPRGAAQGADFVLCKFDPAHQQVVDIAALVGRKIGFCGTQQWWTTWRSPTGWD